ncbi:MAG: cytochrome c family protein [Desulfotignum sp.]|nr:cytochrome c family protein [Desulfotignum sp.]
MRNFIKKKMRNRSYVLNAAVLLIAVAVSGWGSTASSGPSRIFDIDRFIYPDTCSGCHYEIFEQWSSSMHSLSHKDPVYSRVAAFLRQGLTDQGEINEADSCVKCHTPVGVVTGFPAKLADDLSKTPDIAIQGIQCDYCHSAVNVEKMYNNGLLLEPGYGEEDPGIKQGPFDDAEPDFHEAAYSALHDSAEFCGTCHDVRHVSFGTNLETTYTEWKNSPYNSDNPDERITCQGCHMYQRPGVPATASTDRPENPGTAADYSRERPHIFTHYFVGANSGVPADFGDQKKADMAVARLQHAAELDLDLSRLDQKQLGIQVSNTGAGHALPTGLADMRQMWLEITIQDKNGHLIFQTGILDEKKELPEGTLIFRTVFGDGKGNAVINLARAREILSDNRIPAKGQATEVITLDRVLEKESRIQVRLLYRGMPQKILNLLPGEPIGPLPVVEMARVSHTI